MSAKSHQSNLEAALGKIQTCLSHTALKSDEQLAATFESFFKGEQSVSGSSQAVVPLRSFEDLERLLSVLSELEEYPMAGLAKQEVRETPQANSANRLFASLKRHPE
ncbi:MAG: hypothetical protein V4721_02655 [Bacteroidota bacterium]